MLFEFMATVSFGGSSLVAMSVSREASWRVVRLDSLDSLWLRTRAPSRCMAYDILRGILRQSERGIESCGSSFLHEICSILHSFYAEGEVRLLSVFLGIVRSHDQWSLTACCHVKVVLSISPDGRSTNPLPSFLPWHIGRMTLNTI